MSNFWAGVLAIYFIMGFAYFVVAFGALLTNVDDHRVTSRAGAARRIQLLVGMFPGVAVWPLAAALQLWWWYRTFDE